MFIFNVARTHADKQTDTHSPAGAPLREQLLELAQRRLSTDQRCSVRNRLVAQVVRDNCNADLRLVEIRLGGIVATLFDAARCPRSVTVAVCTAYITTENNNTTSNTNTGLLNRPI